LENGELGTAHEGFLNLLAFVTKSDFWSAQINAMELLSNGEILLHQQVGKQVIEFGKPDEIEIKFKKINLFYNEIVPKKGWNAYDRVNVKFKNQIICE
jgi:cell division protein FtsQ